MRVVSLVPSITETLLEWGVDVVACTRFCEQPSLRHVGGTKDPDVAGIIALAPDLVVVDREENRRDDADALVAAGLTLHVTQVVDVEQVPDTLALLADAVAIVAPVATDGSEEPPLDLTAFVPIWRRPTMSINAHTYGSSVLAGIGVTNVLADHPDRYPTVELDDVARRRPDLVLLPSEPYPFGERHRDEYAQAIPGSRVVLLDGRDLFWWGVRTPAAMRRIRAALREASTPS
ncbi:MAG: cobalamin-binding protein [Actinobacteria bacterium]|nr:cobalamin-binding protein [Actinomycetota bacterium]